MSDEAVAAVAAHGSLEALDVSGIPEIGGATVKALATACKCAASASSRHHDCAAAYMLMAPLNCLQALCPITRS